jgi:aarF domain-containing kinase
VQQQFICLSSAGIINLLDFGACREFPSSFVDEYLRVVYAASRKDTEQCMKSSVKLGFLTGEESKVSSCIDTFLWQLLIAGRQ